LVRREVQLRRIRRTLTARLPRFVAVALGLLAIASSAAADDVRFESPPVHPLELSPDAQTLFAVHTDEHRMSVFDVAAGQLTRVAEIAVGLEPVTVRARSNDEIWVLNHLSDSISIVERLGPGDWHVTRTLLVGDEPTDLAFAGLPARAFIVLSQADRVDVFDAAAPGAVLETIELQASDPRSIASSPDGSTLYVTALEGGNRTSIIPADVVASLGGLPAPDPPMQAGLPLAPAVSLIVRQDGNQWRDEADNDWSTALGYDILDHDLVAIDVATATVNRYYSDVGTNLFNVAVNPATGQLLVSAQDSDNLTRFLPKLRGRFLQSRVSRVDPHSGQAEFIHLNDHIDYATPDGNSSERAASLSLPLDIEFASTGTLAFAAAFGSAKIAVLSGGGHLIDRWDTGAGPAGLALDEERNRLYVLNSLDGNVSVHDCDDGAVIQSISLGYRATPAVVQQGRQLFYDAQNSSAHGDLSCASCHLFTGMDGIAWDLGDPLGEMETAPPQPEGFPVVDDFHPMKGPMVTQSLKSLPGTEPFHWRGDQGELEDFNPAFVDLLGRSEPLTVGDFAAMEEFLFSVRYPPNPYRQLDDTLPPTFEGGDPASGESGFNTGLLAGLINCNSCHAAPTGENGTIIVGSGLLQAEGKVIPQLRNLHEKTRFDNEAAQTLRGFGYTHDGAVDDIDSFLDFPSFRFEDTQDRLDMIAFLMTFRTGTPAATGAQWTMDGANAAEGSARIATLELLADANTIGLIAKGRDGDGTPRGWTYAGGGSWDADRLAEPALSTAVLLGLAGPGTELTVTGVVQGTQWRLGVDRDGDGARDADELDAGTDPSDPGSSPQPPTAGPNDSQGSLAARLWLAGPNPTTANPQLNYRIGRSARVQLAVFDVRGRLVRRLLTSPRARPGGHVQHWDLRDDRARSVPSGVYFVRLLADGVAKTTRVTVLR